MPQFRPGKSGNPRGRPKGARNLATQLLEVVNAPSTDERVSKLGAVLVSVVDRAQAGDQRATQTVLDRVEKAEASLREAVERREHSFTDADREVIAEIYRRLAPENPAAPAPGEPASASEPAP